MAQPEPAAIAGTDDALLGGRVRLRQPAAGYRAAIDPVLLAAAVPAQAGQRVVDLGCGAGAVALCLLARCPGIEVIGVERDPVLAGFAAANAEANAGGRFRVEVRDLAAPGLAALGPADHVVANPPFHDPAGDPSPHPGRRRATLEETPLDAWAAAARCLLRPRGRLTLIHRADRLATVLAALGRGFGAIAVLPLWPRAGMPARRVIVSAVAGSRAPLTLLPGLLLHDIRGFTPAAERVLRDAEALPMEPLALQPLEGHETDD